MRRFSWGWKTSGGLGLYIDLWGWWGFGQWSGGRGCTSMYAYIYITMCVCIYIYYYVCVCIYNIHSIYIHTYLYMCSFIRPWWLMLKQGDRRNGLKGEQEHPAKNTNSVQLFWRKAQTTDTRKLATWGCSLEVINGLYITHSLKPYYPNIIPD